MPVRPKTHREPMLMEIGRLFKGSEKQINAKGEAIFGKDLDYYRFVPNDRLKKDPASEGSGYANRYDELLAYYEELERKDKIKIFFPFPNIEQVWRESNEIWKVIKGKQTLVRLCNGEICSVHMEGKRIMRTPIPCAAGPDDKKCPAGCKETGRMPFVIPALKYPGTVMLTTHSNRDIKHLPAFLEAYRGADLRCIPFLLGKIKQNCTHVQEDGSSTNQDRWFCYLEIDPNAGSRLLSGEVSHTRQLITTTQQPLALAGAGSFEVPVDDYKPSEFIQSGNPVVARFEMIAKLTDIPIQVIRSNATRYFKKNLVQLEGNEQLWLVKMIYVLWAQVRLRDELENIKAVWSRFWQKDYQFYEDALIFEKWREVVEAIESDRQDVIDVEVVTE